MRGFLQFLREAMAQNMFRDLATPPPMPLLYHKDVGLPKTFTKPLPGLRLIYGNHAKQAMADEATYVPLPAALPAEFRIIEVEIMQKQVLKWVLRVPTATERDLVMVVQPDGFVRTVWSNDKNDTHKTLKRHLYARPN